MTIRLTSLLWLFCSAAYGSIQVGDFAPHEIGNTWVYEGVYIYNHPVDGGGTAKLIRTIEVKSIWEIADTEFVAIEVLDTGHTVRTGGINWGDSLATDSIFRLFVDTCRFLTGTLINPNGNLFWEGVPFFRNRTIDIDSLLKFQNGDTGYYYIGRDARYVKDVGLCTYRFSNGLNHRASYSLNLISHNGHPYSPGEVIRFERTNSGKVIKENDTLVMGMQQLPGGIYLGYSKFDKIGNYVGGIKVHWKTTGSLSYSIPSNVQETSLWYETSDVTSFQEGFIIATPLDSGVVLSPDRVYVVINPMLNIIYQRQSFGKSNMPKIRNIYNLQGRKLTVYEQAKAISTGFKIICDDKCAKKQIFFIRNQ